MSAAEDFAALAPLVEEMAARGYLDAWLVRHPEQSSHVESAVGRLVATVRGRLSVGSRLAIEATERDQKAVPEIVGCALVETVHKLVDPDPVQSFLDAVNGKHGVVPLATRNRVISDGRKVNVRTRFLVAVEEVPEAVAVDDGPVQAVDDQLPVEWEAAISRLIRRGVKLNKKNLARELGITPRHLRRLMSSFRKPRVK